MHASACASGRKQRGSRARERRGRADCAIEHISRAAIYQTMPECVTLPPRMERARPGSPRRPALTFASPSSGTERTLP